MSLATYSRCSPASLPDRHRAELEELERLGRAGRRASGGRTPGRASSRLTSDGDDGERPARGATSAAAGGDDVEDALGRAACPSPATGIAAHAHHGHLEEPHAAGACVSSGLTSRPVTYTSAPRARAAAMRSKVALWPREAPSRKTWRGAGSALGQRRAAAPARRRSRCGACPAARSAQHRREAAQLAAAAGDHASCRPSAPMTRVPPRRARTSAM